ncbi:hypothetical protein [Leuconostoc gasicomitatum]|uniref:hypothetical protein n=1 Tax=Leuconostoc gasicomitatum TaxID=115778 RepID=UPI001CC6D9B7|nr:hypothetical protein [Leuconostoc gasicomitatum]MBZ5981201.1 hypothetical protein [Leuconostoc gasicomitatum]
MMTDKNMKTVVGIRATHFSLDLEDVFQTIKNIFPGFTVYVVVDETNKKKSGAFPSYMNLLMIDDQLLDDLGLYYKSKKIGWIAGDYAYYIALKYDWDFMWMIEPDVFIGQDSFKILQEAQKSQVDLVGTNINIRSDNWPWTKRMRSTTQFHTISGVFFPLTRVSRRLAVAALKIRREVSMVLEKKQVELQIPNDESTIATTAMWKHYGYLDLKKEFPSHFRNFGWKKRFDKNLLSSGIVHPAHETSIFIEKVVDELVSVLNTVPSYQSLLETDKKNQSEILNRIVK